MDRYLEAITNEETLLGSIEDKKNQLVVSNSRKKKTLESCEHKEQELTRKQSNNFKRQEYLKNKKTYYLRFLSKALKFGIKSSIGFFIAVFMIWLSSTLVSEPFTFNLLELIVGNLEVSGMLGCVEFFNVSRDFRHMVWGYKGDVCEDIATTEQHILAVQNKKTKIQEKILENEQLLSELDIAINMINSKILDYRTKRNNLIEALIEDLDVHIRDFEYQESDIHKLLEKQIH